MKRVYIRKKITKQILQCLKEGESLSIISKKLEISIGHTRKIISALKERGILKTDNVVELKMHFLSKKFKKYISNALKEGDTFDEMSATLGISKRYVLEILSRSKKGKKWRSRGRITTKKIRRIMYVKELYDKLQTLEKVAARLKITRERVRQVLEEGAKNKLFAYKPYREGYTENVSKQISKEQIAKELVLHGNCNNLIMNYNLPGWVINKLLKFYSIDAAYIKRLRNHKRDLKQYQSIVDFLGYHPTTTELSKKKEWRNLWHRIYHNWESFDNFRKEYGIPMPPKGYSKFKEKALPVAIEATRKKGRENRDKIKLEILSLLEKHKGNKLAAHKIAGLINKNEMTVRRCLLELSKENKIDVIKEPKGTNYFLKEQVYV